MNGWKNFILHFMSYAQHMLKENTGYLYSIPVGALYIFLRGSKHVTLTHELFLKSNRKSITLLKSRDVEIEPGCGK